MVAGSQEHSSLSQSAFKQLLTWLDGGVDSGGEKYIEIRRRLVHYFRRKNCLTPDELADETLNRVTRQLGEQGNITHASPAQYCYTVAKFVLLEYFRRPGRTDISLDGLGNPPALPPDDTVAIADRERRIHWLESCLLKLPPDQRQMILEYYHGELRTKIENRRGLASKLGLTMNALSIRACRIREALEDCVRKRVAEQDGFPGNERNERRSDT